MKSRIMSLAFLSIVLIAAALAPAATPTTRAIRVGPGGDVGALDELRAPGKLNPGDEIRLLPGTYTHGGLSLPDRATLRAADPKNRPVVRNGFLIKAAGVRVLDLDFDSLTPAVELNGASGAVIERITQRGEGMLVQFHRCAGVAVNDCRDVRGRNKWYPFFGGIPGAPSGITITRATIDVISGEHGARFHNFRDITIADSTFNYASPYNGAAITPKDGNGIRLLRDRINGVLGIGPLSLTQAKPGTPGKLPADREIVPALAALHTFGVEVGWCSIDSPRYTAFEAGVVGFNVHDTTIRARHQACLVFLPRYGLRDPATGSFTRVHFIGAGLASDGSKPNMAGVRFFSCDLNGKPIDGRGNVINAKTP